MPLKQPTAAAAAGGSTVKKRKFSDVKTGSGQGGQECCRMPGTCAPIPARQLFFMDTSKLDERKMEHVNLSRDEVLLKKRMMATTFAPPVSGFGGFGGICGMGGMGAYGGFGGMGGMSGMGEPSEGFTRYNDMGCFGGIGAIGAPPMMSAYGGMGAPTGGFMASMVTPSSDAYRDSTGNFNIVQVSNGE